VIAISTAVCVPASAQGWKPHKAVEVIVSTTPGGGIDRTARLLQKILQEGGLLKVPVVVVNKPGGGGTMQVTYLNQHPSDGHYIAVNSSTLIQNDINGRSTVKYTDVTPLCNLFSEYILIAVRADSPLKTGRDFIEQLRREPTSLTISVGAVAGGANHLSIALLGKAVGVDVKKVRVPIFGSSAEGTTALLGGHIDAAAGTPSSIVAMVRAGKVRALGILSPTRIAAPYADTPTWTEQGYPVVMKTWRGVIAPKGTTPEQVAFWENILEKAVGTEMWKQSLEQNVAVADYLNSAQTRRLYNDQYVQDRTLLRDLGMVK
jgi:putative tricarboxylic transport membrane protein